MTGLELIKELNACSSEIDRLARFITQHPMAPSTTQAEVMRIDLEDRREILRKQLDEEEDLSFT